MIETVSFWRRNISAEIATVKTEHLSSLFNAFFFIRAIEDAHIRHDRLNLPRPPVSLRDLVTDGQATAHSLILKAVRQYAATAVSDRIANLDLLKAFDALDPRTLRDFVDDFYYNRYSKPYKYDFFLMSKHALSRVYEKYTSVLATNDSEQFFLFPPLPTERRNKAYGSVYTPEFIARFFARYVRDSLPPSQFRSIQCLEPAMGSSIFLRAFLELICDPLQPGFRSELVESAFRNVTGVDVDPNARNASDLSLSLLHFVLTQQFPTRLKLITSEIIEYACSDRSTVDFYDVVVANPPFIAWSALSVDLRTRLVAYLGALVKNRPDLYFAFLKFAVDKLKPGGFGCFVLPEVFLSGDSGSKIREYISTQCVIRVLTDLSRVNVFGQKGIYVILIIFQKRHPHIPPELPCIAAISSGSVGRCFESVLSGMPAKTDSFEVFHVPQGEFLGPDWRLKPPRQREREAKLARHPTLSEYAKIMQGVNTGNDSVFIVSRDQIADLDSTLFRPYLPDREIDAYRLPSRASRFVFFPVVNGKKVTEKELRERFPKTWAYLSAHKGVLAGRGQNWWMPERLRLKSPDLFFRPKIIAPHLVIMPRFALDIKGTYVVSRTPMIVPKSRTGDEDLLKYLLGVLNSPQGFQLIVENTRVYGGGYSMLEVDTLSAIRIPNPSSVPVAVRKKLIGLVDKRLASSVDEQLLIEEDIAEVVTEIYQS